MSQNLKLFRLTLDQLSRKSGASKGMLVEIEKGSANPSIATLCKMAVALGVSVADFVGVGIKCVSTDRALARHVCIMARPWRRQYHAPCGNSRSRRGELRRWILFPGETFESPEHSAGTLELLNVETGELTLKLAGTELVVQSGSSVLARTEDKHAYMNRGTQELRFIMVVAELRPRIPHV
ncbi:MULTISPECIES: cupin domain-containing protein [Mesorhizobium]|uniref:cupin domain-containing protein n=1 Tax=Mesorhizobium TaxID=68287 RepID=UPI0021E8A8AE|nr:cupin domain-containing protein [Mesorhizobium sp. ZC-5]MCV3244036.1 cupin domain-containing protein [Mesorhizobium sp. ZC-5]